ncbi:MAG TPA: alpha/beta fold hydrolase, partial [Acidimicrobiia bacterium]|nr:alpha/beta fold hydrolase [Acidimicrobiia bacterium]
MGGMRIEMDDGVGLAVEVAGTGPGLMLVHGFGGAKEDFADHIDAFAQDHTVVVFDHRGHGASDKPADRAMYTMPRLVNDTLAVADAAGLAEFVILGHSMGGIVARKIVLCEPERVRALIMMDSFAGPIYDCSLLDIAADIALTQGKDALKELLDFAQPLETPAYQRLINEQPGYQEFVDRKWNDLSEIMWGSLARELGHQSDDLDALAQALRVPLLVLVGELDTDFVPEAARIKAAIPSAEHVVIPNAGHS